MLLHNDPPNPLIPFLSGQGTVILDGALATELERRGADLNHPMWSAKLLTENPDLIRSVHYAYLAAGADVVISASYQATLQGFERMGIGSIAAADLLRASVDLACQARDDFWSNPRHRDGRQRPIVAASVGPYGAYLADGSEYRGRYGLSVRDLVEFHAERIEILAATDADLLALETIPCLDEAHALVELVDRYEKWAWLSYACCDGAHICAGEPFREALAVADQSPWFVAVGMNCTAPNLIEPLLQYAAEATTKPIVVYPNRGEIWDAEQRVWLPNPNEVDILSAVPKWQTAGARLIGGCCRTTPSTIASISDFLRHRTRVA